MLRDISRNAPHSPCGFQTDKDGSSAARPAPAPESHTRSVCVPCISPRSKRFDGIIDSGASGCLFHGSIGRAIGLEIEKGIKASTLGVGGAMEIFLHEVTIYIPGGPITTIAGFSDQASLAGLLGMLGFFEHFKIVFDPLNLRVELERQFRA